MNYSVLTWRSSAEFRPGNDDNRHVDRTDDMKKETQQNMYSNTSVWWQKENVTKLQATNDAYTTGE